MTLSTYPVAMLAYNNIDLTRQAVASVFAQDVGPIELWLIDNGSTDDTISWAREIDPPYPHLLHVIHHATNQSPVRLTNDLLDQIFHSGYQFVLGVPNDIILPPNLYRELLRWPRGVVAASQTSQQDFPIIASASAVSDQSPMAVALIRRWFHDALVAKDGYFLDPKFWLYASDCDLALRMASCGLRGVQLDIQFWHYCSATWKLAPDTVSRNMIQQADADRAYFERKWSFKVDDPQYSMLAGDINFRGESK